MIPTAPVSPDIALILTPMQHAEILFSAALIFEDAVYHGETGEDALVVANAYKHQAYELIQLFGP
jgi:hypothetical protein